MARAYPKYERIKDYLVKGIKARNFTAAVPSENQLAEKFGVSRMTARKAVDAAEREGFVERRPGKGTFVKKKQHYTTGFFRVRPFQKWADDLNVAVLLALKDPVHVGMRQSYHADLHGIVLPLHVGRCNDHQDQKIKDSCFHGEFSLNFRPHPKMASRRSSERSKKV